MVTGHPTRKSWWQSPGVLIFAVLGAVVATQTLLKPGHSIQRPGTERGDIRLAQESLPEFCAGWKRIGFTPPDEVDHLPEGQFWWVHQWLYSKDGRTAGVCFDQLGLNDWHELTVCYQALGWRLVDRSVQTARLREAAEDWKYVVATLENATGQQAILVFSLFYDDGSPVEPETAALSLFEATQPESTRPTMAERIFRNPQPRVVHTRSLQCQVFAEVRSTHTDELKNIIELHIASRLSFRQTWLELAALPRSR
jgi:hypothetical protein